MLRWVVILVAVVVVLSTPADVFAWGPATHMKLASDVLRHLVMVPTAVAVLLRRHPRDYMFGNIAADVVLGKRFSRVKQFCHHWGTGFELLEDARDDRGKAFAFGYLSHLAADTVAHNKFIPRQMALTRTTLSFGHLYWELRADGTIGSHYWNELRSILDDAFSEHRRVLSSRMDDTFLPFAINWRLFYRMNRFVSRQSLHWVMDRWYLKSRWPLSDQLMRDYRVECFNRIVDVLRNESDARVLHEDPNGNAALAHTKVQRRQLRQMARSGLIAPHVLYEAAKTHAPVNAAETFFPMHEKEQQ